MFSMCVRKGRHRSTTLRDSPVYAARVDATQNGPSAASHVSDRRAAAALVRTVLGR